MGRRVLVIDNYDSFVYNLVQYLGELGAEPLVHRHDALTLDQAIDARPRRRADLARARARPTTPGCRNEVIRHFAGTQAGVRRVPRPPVHRPGVRRHGGAGARGHARQDLADPPPRRRRVRRPAPPLEATRYHSLIVDRDSVPDVLEITAETDDGIVMGLRHRDAPDVEGVQFHPESILTVGGHDLVGNFLAQVDAYA